MRLWYLQRFVNLHLTGVAVSSDETRVFVCETFAARILQIDLCTGKTSVFAEGFPDYCDGISIVKAADGKDMIFVAIPSPAPLPMMLLAKLPTFACTFVRNLLLALPVAVRKVLKK